MFMINTFDYFRTKPNLKIMKYSFSDAKAFHIEIMDTKTQIRGFGGDMDPQLAQTKALYELIERTVFHERSVAIENTSSGWSAHQTKENALQGSQFELLERDAILCCWLSKTPPKIVDDIHLPLFKRNFQLLQFAEGADYYVLGFVLECKETNSRMLISTCARTIKLGLSKLEVDAERAFFILSVVNPVENTILKVHHEKFCALNNSDISWIYKGGNGLKNGKFRFDSKIFEVPLWNGSTAYVCNSTSEEIQQLFFGQQGLSNISRKRLRSIMDFPYKLNRVLHPIL